MASIGDSSFQPLEGLASSGKQYVDGVADANSNTFEPLQGAAWQDRHNPGAAAVLPMLTQMFVVSLGGFGQSHTQLPRLSSDGWTGGQGETTLPALSGAGTGTVPGQALGEATLPALLGAGSGTGGVGVASAIFLPRLVGTGWFAGLAAATLPRLSATGAGTTAETGTGAAILPALRGSGTSAVASYPSYGHATLPALRAGPSGYGAVILPMLRGVGYDAGAVAGNGVGVGQFEGWAMNVRTGFIGRIANWPFRQIVKWGDKLLGVGADGLYLIGGTKDVGATMQWEWRTGLDDMNQSGIKRVPYVYLDAVIDGEIEITTVDDRGDVRAYHYEADRGRINLPHRRQLGMGVRTRNIAFGARNGTNGAYMELYGIEPEATITQRSI